MDALQQAGLKGILQTCRQTQRLLHLLRESNAQAALPVLLHACALTQAGLQLVDDAKDARSPQGRKDKVR